MSIESKRLKELLNVQLQTQAQRNKAFHHLTTVTETAYYRRSWYDIWLERNTPDTDPVVIRATNFVDSLDKELRQQETLIRACREACDFRTKAFYTQVAHDQEIENEGLYQENKSLQEEVNNLKEDLKTFVEGYEKKLKENHELKGELFDTHQKLDQEACNEFFDNTNPQHQNKVFHLERELNKVKALNQDLKKVIDNRPVPVGIDVAAYDREAAAFEKLSKTSDHNNGFDVDTLQSQLMTARSLALMLGAASVGMEDFNQHNDTTYSDTNIADSVAVLVEQLDKAMWETDKLQMAIVGDIS